MKLQQIIDDFKNERFKQIPDDIKAVMKSSTEDLIKAGIQDSIPGVGKKLPDFCLKNYDGTDVILSEEVKNGNVILTFYRGGWCPYCNLQLNYLQSRMNDFLKYNGRLIAVSPELPDLASLTVEKHKIRFKILSDIGNEVGKKYGIVFKLPDDLAGLYVKLGIDLKKYNGNGKNEIPIPATFVIDKDMTVRYSFGMADYTKRAEPDDIIDVLKKLS